MTTTLRSFATAYGAAALVFLALDALWLGTMAARLYRPILGPLMRGQPDLLAAAAFYGLYLAGLVVLVIAPAVAGGRVGTALARGALFGLVAYATYDLTNQATLQGWSWRITLVDLAWGTFVTGVACAAGAWAALRWGR